MAVDCVGGVAHPSHQLSYSRVTGICFLSMLARSIWRRSSRQLLIPPAKDLVERVAKLSQGTFVAKQETMHRFRFPLVAPPLSLALTHRPLLMGMVQLPGMRRKNLVAIEAIRTPHEKVSRHEIFCRRYGDADEIPREGAPQRSPSAYSTSGARSVSLHSIRRSHAHIARAQSCNCATALNRGIRILNTEIKSPSYQ